MKAIGPYGGLIQRTALEVKLRRFDKGSPTETVHRRFIYVRFFGGIGEPIRFQTFSVRNVYYKNQHLWGWWEELEHRQKLEAAAESLQERADVDSRERMLREFVWSARVSKVQKLKIPIPSR
jgi:hypothetical protein